MHRTACPPVLRDKPASVESRSFPAFLTDLELLKQSFNDVQQNVPRHGLEVLPVLLDESCYGQNNLI